MSYELEFSQEALTEIKKLKKSGDKAIINKLNELILELMEHPYTGTGRPEELKYDLAGRYSRRITLKHRLIYRVDDEKVTVLILSVDGHYGDR